MSRRISQPLPWPTPEYDVRFEETMRRQVEQNFQDVYADLDKAKLYDDAEASLAVRRYTFLSAIGITTYG